MSRLASFLIFFAIALSLIGGMHYYVWARLVRDPQLPGLVARISTGALIALGLAMPLTLIVSRFFATSVVRPAIWLTFIWMGVGFLLVAFFGIADVGRLAAWMVARLSGPVGPADPSKRVLLARTVAAGVGSVVAGLAATGVKTALGNIDVKEVDVALKNLPRELSGLKLVQISDVHIGPLLRKDWLEHVVANMKRLQPDLVAITGDLVDGTVDELREHVAPLASLQARYGVFFSTGNHEYYSGVRDWIAYLPSLGVKPLMNERREIAPGLEIAGIEDPTGAPDLPRTLAGRDPSKALILLAHQPRQFREAARHDVGLTLSGHTHGGQIWPFSWIVALVQPYLAGLHKLGDSLLYVSRGTGFWGPPMRVFAPPEITLIKLTAA